MGSNILWTPSQEFINSSNLKKFEIWLAENKGLRFEDYDALWNWSIDKVDDFWESISEYFKILHHTPYSEVLSKNHMPNAKWFSGSTLNYAEHIFRMKSDDRPALIFQNEKMCKHVSWNQLEQEVISFRNFLTNQGLKQGDRIAAYLPNIPETISCFLAANSLGIIWSCCSPDFGVETVIDRFAQIEPKLFIACDGYQYNGKPYSKLQEVDQIRERISSIEQTVFIPYLDEDAVLKDCTAWLEVQNNFNSGKLSFAAVDFDHPMWVLYSSGTTGKPKAITHSHGGVLLEHLRYMSFHNDVKVGENFFWFTTTGWMMWNFLQASLLCGATAVLFDGSPAFPNLDQLWNLAEDLPIHHFGTSAPYLTACMNKELDFTNQGKFKELRSIGSTGAPLPSDTFEWIYQSISSDVWLCSMSGGTDVCTAFVGGNPYSPVISGKIQSRTLGTALMAYNDNGVSVKNQLGEMVIEKPMPSMPIYFWNDQNNERYLASYFENYPGKWRHGDWIEISDDGSLIIQGRSDSTLNRNGIRIGTAEIYNVLNKIAGISDALIINVEQPDGGDIMPLFLVMEDGANLDDDFKRMVKKTLRSQCSPRHVPDQIIQAPDIPFTLSGKKMEVPVKKLFMNLKGSNLVNRDAIKNPKAMDFFEEFAIQFKSKKTS